MFDGLKMPLPAMMLAVPVEWLTFHTNPADCSTAYKFCDESIASPFNSLNWTWVAGPPFPLDPATPVPAKVEIKALGGVVIV